MGETTSNHELGLATRYDIYGCVALVSACVAILVPTLIWLFMVVGVIFGGEARCNKYSKAGRIFGIIAEVIISIEVIILYAVVFSTI